MARSVLRVRDQVAGRIPDPCVLSGVATDRAVRLVAVEWSGARWLLGAPGFGFAVGHLPGRERLTVVLPVSKRVWVRWRCRDLATSVALASGGTFAAIGLATAVAELTVVGVTVVLGAGAYRTRAHRNYWVTCRLRPADGTVVVEPTHRRFDEAARALFLRSLH